MLSCISLTANDVNALQGPMVLRWLTVSTLTIVVARRTSGLFYDHGTLSNQVMTWCIRVLGVFNVIGSIIFLVGYYG
jgi:hypothetical protein